MAITAQKHLRAARQLTALLDTKFSLLGVRFGIDPLLNLIPGAGNLIGTVAACYLFFIAYKLRVPWWVHARMLWNITLDYFFGFIPVIGIVFDLFHRANTKNLKLISTFADEDVLEGEVV